VIDPKTSKEKAAALIEAKDPLSAFVASYRNWDSKHGDAFEAVKTISPVTQAKLDANTQVLAQMGARGTPAFIFKDGVGKINRIQGAVTAEQMPSIMKATIPGSVIAPAGAPTALSAY
jgi:thiol:disulfide interchange protein DsbG